MLPVRIRLLLSRCRIAYLVYFIRDSNRILTSSPSPAIPADQMTVQKCIDGCTAAGFSSAGVEYGKECYCGNLASLPNTGAPIEECNMGCLGDASQYVLEPLCPILVFADLIGP
jgi:hypothetical protein